MSVDICIDGLEKSMLAKLVIHSQFYGASIYLFSI